MLKNLFMVAVLAASMSSFAFSPAGDKCCSKKDCCTKPCCKVNCKKDNCCKSGKQCKCSCGCCKK